MGYKQRTGSDFQCLAPCVVFAFLSGLLCLLSGCGSQGAPGGMGMGGAAPKAEVVVDKVAQEDVQLYIYVPGQMAPYKYVDITARVAGFLEKLYFRSGSIVKEGDKLAMIEQEQYKIALAASEAELANAEARASLAKSNLDRGKQLVESRALSPEEFQERQAAYDMALATVATARASIRQAKLNLEYTEIFAPIPGKTTKNLVDIGSFVSQSNVISSNSAKGDTTPSTKLLSIAQMDPMYIDFLLSDKQFADMKERMGFRESYDEAIQKLLAREATEQMEQLEQVAAPPVASNQNSENPPVVDDPRPSDRILASADAGDGQRELARIDVSLTTGMDVLSSDFPLPGHIVAMIDNRINYETGQITMRGQVRNPLLNVNGTEDYMLYPGQICRVRIPYENVQNAVLVHEESILTDLDTKYVLVIQQEQAVKKDMLGRPVPDKDGNPEFLYKTDEKGVPVLDEAGKPVVETVDVVHRRDIKIGKLLDTQQRIVLEGLDPGETYIVKGVQRARIGVPVSPVSLEDFQKRRSANGKSNRVKDDGAKNNEANAESVSPTETDGTHASPPSPPAEHSEDPVETDAPAIESR